MRCEFCQGSGFAHAADYNGDDGKPIRAYLPCHWCGGCGIAHCCDGMREQDNGLCSDPTDGAGD